MVSDLAKAALPDYAAIFQTLPGMYLLLSPDLRVQAATNAYLECISANPGQVIGKTIHEVFDGASAENSAFVSSLNSLLNAVLANGKPLNAEGLVRIPQTAGQTELCDQTWKITCIPVKNDQGELNCILHIAENLQEQQEAERELKESIEQFRFLADTIPQLVWTTDPTGYHDYFNKRWTEFTGYTLEDSKGPDMWNNLLHPDDRARARECWNKSLTTGEPYEIEYRFKAAADGQYYWFLARALPMRNAEGKIVRWFGTCTDISRKKQYEEELKEKNMEMKLINDDLDSFVYMASHDLKLPVINISALFEELLLNVEFKEADAEIMVGMVRKALNQVHETINDLSEIVKVQKNVYSQQEEVNLADLLEEVKVALAEQIMESGAKIDADFGVVPTLRFSKLNLKSVLYNLLSNAIKFRSAERTPHIIITASNQGQDVRLDVQDNGIGIDLNKHGDKLFQMFKRFHNHVEGTGLGLHIISRILHKSGGKILVDSKPGQGTTFSLIFTNTNWENGRQ